MARPISEKVKAIQDALRARLETRQTGERFLSARAVAAIYGVSYQTAHRLLTALKEEGLVERRAASGTYFPGGAASPASFSRLLLVFSERARRPHSFGACLLQELGGRLRSAGFPWEMRWAESATLADIPPDAFPLFWEAPLLTRNFGKTKRRALLLNALPAHSETSMDSVTVNDFDGGAQAAETLRRRGAGKAAQIALVTGPENDPRSNARRDGFLSRFPQATVISSGGWFQEAGYDSAANALHCGPDGIFCANDRLAEGVLRYAARFAIIRPAIIGFDDAPIAAARDLTTIAIPWEAFTDAAVEILRRRFAGDAADSFQRVIVPQLILRDL